MRLRLSALLVALLLVLAACGGEEPAPSPPAAGTGPGASPPAADAPAGGAATTPAPPAETPEPAPPYEGLRLHVRPLPGTEEVALVVLFDVGEDHDPEGKSGLGHLVEHCYVTCAAGDVPARSADEMMARYPQRWNAQTGSRYTVIAFVFPKADLETEVREAGLRMKDLRIEDADVERERPRMMLEIDHMFDGWPPLAARNRARERVRPSAPGARRGGAPEQVLHLTADDAREHWARYYKPRNALVVLAGAVEAEAGRALLQEAFGDAPIGELPPRPRARSEPEPGVLSIRRTEAVGPDQPGHLAVGYPAPRPGDPLYAPFLVIVANLFQGSRQAPFEVEYAALDDPEALFLTAPVAPGETPQEVLDRITIEVKPRGEVTDRLRNGARDAFAYFLGTRELPDLFLARNLYGTAFALGRRAQMGLDGEALARAIQAVDAAALAKAADAFFSLERRAPVAVLPKAD